MNMRLIVGCLLAATLISGPCRAIAAASDLPTINLPHIDFHATKSTNRKAPLEAQRHSKHRIVVAGKLPATAPH